MRKTYLTFIPIYNSAMANIFRNEAAWEVMHTIRKAGKQGVTVREIIDQTEMKQGSIYKLLDKLKMLNFVVTKKYVPKKRKLGRPKIPKLKETLENREMLKRASEYLSGRKTPTLYYDPCEKKSGLVRIEIGEQDTPWGDITFSSKFQKTQKYLEKQEETVKMKKYLFDYIIKMFKNLKQENKFKRILPEEDLCNDCNKSHEAVEFFKAMALMSTIVFLESDEFSDLLRKTGFMKL